MNGSLNYLFGNNCLPTSPFCACLSTRADTNHIHCVLEKSYIIFCIPFVEENAEEKPITEEVDKKMVQDDITHDGAEEKMLNNENDDAEKLTGKKEEIKFIAADHKNGDAKIDIGEVDKKVGFFVCFE